MALISVIIPAFNAERYLDEAVRSALAQSFKDIEVIVINDGSTDQTHQILEKLSRAHNQITAIANDRNKGAAFSRNVGIEAANGDWIALLDADDWWDPRRLTRLLEVAEKHSADIVADNLCFVDGRSLTPWRTLFPGKNCSATSISVDDFLRNDMPGDFGTWGLLKPMFKKSFLSQNNIRYNESMWVRHDNEMYLECFYRKPTFLLCSEPLYYYRFHRESISTAVAAPDLLRSQEVNRRYLAKFRDETAQSTCELLKRRISRFDKYIRYRKVIEPLKRRDWTAAAKQAAGDFGIIGFVARMFLNLVGRTVRRKLVTVSRRGKLAKRIGQLRKPAPAKK